MATLYKAQITFQGASGSPLDKYVNDLHFDGADSPTDPQWDALVADIIEFYTEIGPSQANRICDYFSTSVAETGHQIRIYEGDTAPPHVPLVMATFDLPVAPSIEGYPEEVALVLSIRGNIVAGTDTGPGPHLPARHRNRIYLGPLVQSCGEFVSGGVRPTAETRDDIVGGALDWLVDDLDGDWNWWIWSPTRSAGEEVLSWWVDNAFDTQRRRGCEPNARTQAERP